MFWLSTTCGASPGQVAAIAIRHIQQQRHADIVAPVKGILQDHYRIASLFIKTDKTGIAAYIANLPGNFFLADLVGNPGKPLPLIRPMIITAASLGKYGVERAILGFRDVVTRIRDQIFSVAV